MRRKVAELEDLSKATLSAYAQGLGLKFSTTLKKEELLAMLLESTDLQLHTLMELTIADDQKVVSIKRFEAPPDQATTAVASTAEAAIATVDAPCCLSQCLVNQPIVVSIDLLPDVRWRWVIKPRAPTLCQRKTRRGVHPGRCFAEWSTIPRASYWHTLDIAQRGH